MKKLPLLIILSFSGFSTFSQSVKLTFDYNQSNLIVQALQNPETIDDAFIANLKSDYTTPFILQRVQQRYPNATLDTLIADLRKVAKDQNLGRDDYFRLQLTKRNLQNTVDLINRIKNNQAEIEKEVSEKLASYIAQGGISVTIRFICTGASFGFAPDSKNFCVGLHWYDGDLTGVRWVMTHELFHNIQAVNYPGSKAEKVKEFKKSLSDHENLLYTYLLSTYKEGTGTYISNVEDYTSAYTKQHLDRQKFAERIMTDDFLLFETIIYRLHNDTKFTNGDLIYNIGSSWDWGNPNYYIGYFMSKMLVKYKGTDYIKNSLPNYPTQFFIDYFEVANQHKDDKSIIHFTPEIQKIISDFHKRISK